MDFNMHIILSKVLSHPSSTFIATFFKFVNGVKLYFSLSFYFITLSEHIFLWMLP